MGAVQFFSTPFELVSHFRTHSAIDNSLLRYAHNTLRLATAGDGIKQFRLGAPLGPALHR